MLLGEVCYLLLFDLGPLLWLLLMRLLLFAAKFCSIAHLCVYTMLQVVLPY